MSYRCASRTSRSRFSQQFEKVRRAQPERLARVGETLERTRPSRLNPIVAATAAVVSLNFLTPQARAQIPSQDFFPIGVHSQPKNSFDKWKSRGINTLFQYEAENNGQGIPQVSLQLWSQTAASKGLYYVRQPSANPADDLQEPYLLGWAQKDEPDLSNHSPNPAVNIDIYQNWKAIGPAKPVWINFAGPNVTVGGADYRQWVKGGDWIASDWYPINWARYNNIGFTGQAIDKLRKDSNGVPKKFLAYIETSWQRLSPGTRGPTRDEFRGSVWDAIVHGAGGIIYFPQVVPNASVGGSFSYDGTPADVVAEMTSVDAQIQSYARVLNSTYNPSSRNLTSSNGAIEATWRVMQDGDYFFVLNLSGNTLTGVPLNLTGLTQGVTSLAVLGENRSETLVGTNQIIDNFSPYQVHVYRTGALPGEPVPEPTGLASIGAAACGALALRRRRTRDATR